MRIVLLGAPGSGKGTQAKQLCAHYRVPHISTGDILRAAVEADNELGKRVSASLKAGQLVSDGIVIDAVTDSLRAPDSRRGFILDGFPRNIPQAQELDTRLSWMDRPLQLALNFYIEPEHLLKRVTGRITCSDCGAIFNRYFIPTEKRGVCDQCGSANLTRRSDDQAKTFSKRLEAYLLESEPLIDYFRAQQKLRTVRVEDDAAQVFETICSVIDAEIRPFDKKVSAGDMTTRSASLTSRVISGGAVVRAKVKKKPAAAKAKPKAVIKEKVVKKPAAAKAKLKAVIKKKVVKKPVAAKAKPKAVVRGKTTKTTVQKKQTARSGTRNKKR
jgi:adenylate kinase